MLRSLLGHRIRNLKKNFDYSHLNGKNKLKKYPTMKMNKNIFIKIKEAQVYLQELTPILRFNKCCTLGPKAPNKWGGSPLDSRSACKRPTSLLSSLSEVNSYVSRIFVVPDAEAEMKIQLLQWKIFK